MYIPFGHSFWAFFRHVFEQMLVIWGVGFLGDEGNHAKARAASGMGQEFVVQSQAGTSSFSSWIFIEWDTLIWRVSDSPSASSAPLKGVLHHPKQRAIDLIDITSE